MKPIRCFSLIASFALADAGLPAPTPISSGHTDIGIGYEEGAFDLHVHDEENGLEYSPADALLVVKSQALRLSPGGAFSFLGPVGTPVWELPKVQDPELLFLGIGAEELVPSDWTGNIEFSLKAVSGPGNFYLWDTDVFGNPVVKMDSANGIGPDDTVSVIPGSHTHLNWGFSAPGVYRISFETVGLNTTDGPEESGPVVYNFEVVPEPSALALAAVGMGAVMIILRQRKQGVCV
ncbi:MAG TPA: choice-of-anchor M domain-containing protein [Verrucomicrobiota bacterium]|nr:choice-of-anchor M domain-containing protein [Verrucomicrobiota bacterium]